MERVTVLQGIRLTPSDLAILRALAGPRGNSKLIRGLIRTEAQRRGLPAVRGRDLERLPQAAPGR